MRRLMSWVGSPTAVRIRSMVTNPALGILAAPTLANVAVRLWEQMERERKKCVAYWFVDIYISCQSTPESSKQTRKNEITNGCFPLN